MERNKSEASLIQEEIKAQNNKKITHNFKNSMNKTRIDVDFIEIEKYLRFKDTQPERILKSIKE